MGDRSPVENVLGRDNTVTLISAVACTSCYAGAWPSFRPMESATKSQGLNLNGPNDILRQLRSPLSGYSVTVPHPGVKAASLL